MAFHHRSAFPAFLLTAGSALACAPLEPAVVEFEFRAHALEGGRCGIDPDENPDLTLQALGPFPISRATSERLPLRTSEHTFAFPEDTRGVEAVASDGAARWIGYADRRANDGFDVLLWREGLGCELVPPESAYPGGNGGQAIGYSPETGIVLVAGGDSDASPAGGALVFDANTGRYEVLDSDQSFPDARAYATVTPFSSRLLLAGGESPLDAALVAERETLDSAAVYDPATGGFTSDVIELEFRRTRHAAIVLPGGQTLLVGGARARGDGGMTPITQFELVSPESGRSTITGVVGLANGRLEPTVLKLDGGNLLVAGGYDVNGEPVSSLEWFSPDASCALSPITGQCTSEPPSVRFETPRHHRTFVAMPGAGAISVGGCMPATQDDACERACGTGFGCPAPDVEASWISPDGTITPIVLETGGDCADEGTVPPTFSPERALLAPGSDGSPWLFAYDEDASPPCRAVFRLNPWRRFSSQDPSPVFESVARAAFDPVHWPHARAPIISLGPDAFVWLGESAVPVFMGARAGVRGALSQYETSLLYARSESALRPVYLSPDRPPGLADRPKATFTPGWQLVLEVPDEPDEPVVTVHVTDTAYDDVAVSLAWSQSPPVLLFGSYEVGGRDCAWPEPPVGPLVAERRGTRIVATNGEGDSVRCSDAPSGPVTLATRAGASATTVTSFVVRRLSD